MGRAAVIFTVSRRDDTLSRVYEGRGLAGESDLSPEAKIGCLRAGGLGCTPAWF
jgi:hypothetical protein